MNALEQTFDAVIQAIELEPIAPLRPGQKAGWVYFIACPKTMRLKIGFTKGKVEDRLKNLQTGSASELRLIAKQPGTVDTERALHARFAKQRLHGEWFEPSPELLAYLWATMWVYARMCLKLNLEIEPWVRVGLRMLQGESGIPLPDDLAALIADDRQG